MTRWGCTHHEPGSWISPLFPASFALCLACMDRQPLWEACREGVIIRLPLVPLLLLLLAGQVRSISRGLPVRASTRLFFATYSRAMAAEASASVKYSSTRGACKGVNFRDVVMGGLAPDKGLYVPETIPTFTRDEIEEMRGLSFSELAFKLMSSYVGPEDIPSDDLKDIVNRSYTSFRDTDVTPVRRVGPVWVLELFHGPTFAFKDVALQFLGNLFEYFLTHRTSDEQQERLTILGATSGDTGSAAIYGLRGKQNVNCFILYPKGRTSAIQERQMTTVPDENIHCINVEGNFDDCQAIVKAAFNDKAFREQVSLGAVNSINWARVLAQITYYFHAYFQVTNKLPGRRDKLNFVVPTGNFGDVLAGYYAKKMGLPIDKLVVATNSNDILHRFFQSGKYHRSDVTMTYSPSMDISVSSNFERYLYDLCGQDAKVLNEWMTEFEATGKLTITGELLEQAQSDFLSGRGDEKETLATMKKWYSNHRYLLCPHSAVGIKAAEAVDCLNETSVCLATAHPAKFPEATTKLDGIKEALPAELAALESLPMRTTPLPNDAAAVKSLLLERLGMQAATDGGAKPKCVIA